MAERWRDIGGPVGRLEPGARNAITDVPGVRVGHAQAEGGERTGVTVVAPPSLPALAGVQTVNGMGELTGWLEIEESGRVETPVYLCGTHALGTVYQAAIVASGHGPDNVTIAVVGECDDGDMADSRTVTAGDVQSALDALGTEVAEGTRRRGHRHGLLRVPRWHRHRLAPRSRATPSACCCSATSATATTWTCSRARRPG